MRNINKKDGLTTKKETIVTFLKEPLVSFVSLVKHGANNTPFRIVKSNKGGNLMGKIIQAVMVPKDSTVDIKKLMGADIRDDAVTDDGSYKLYEQVDKSVVDVSSKSLVVVDPDEHVYAVTYDLLVDKDAKKAEEMDAGVSTKSTPKDVKEVGFYDLWEELIAVGDVISGAMSQSVASEEERKNIVLKAIDNFRIFCEAVFSQAKTGEMFTPVRKIGEGVVGDLTILNKQVSELLKTQGKGGKAMFDFETKEELGVFISGIVASTLEKKAKDAATVQAAKDAVAATEAKDADFKALKETVEKTVATIEKISGTVITPKSEEGDPPDKKEQKPGRYGGLFSKLQTSPNTIS